MKYLLLLLPVLSYGQAKDCNKTLVGIGITGGYSSRSVPVAEMYLGFKAAKRIAIYPLSIKVLGGLGNPSIPTIFESRVAYTKKGWEIYGGYGFHAAGQDGKAEFRKYAGFKPGYGIMKHLGKFVVSAGMAGKIFTLQVGVFGFR